MEIIPEDVEYECDDGNKFEDGDERPPGTRERGVFRFAFLAVAIGRPALMLTNADARRMPCLGFFVAVRRLPPIVNHSALSGSDAAAFLVSHLPQTIRPGVGPL